MLICRPTCPPFLNASCLATFRFLSFSIGFRKAYYRLINRSLIIIYYHGGTYRSLRSSIFESFGVSVVGVAEGVDEVAARMVPVVRYMKAKMNNKTAVFFIMLSI